MTECRIPPPGWRCTREAGHEGPCAAVEKTSDTETLDRLERLLVALRAALDQLP